MRHRLFCLGGVVENEAVAQPGAVPTEPGAGQGAEGASPSHLGTSGDRRPAATVQPLAGEGQTPAGTATASPPALVPDRGIDWDSDQNPYKQRFTGLQGNFKQVQTQNQTLMAQMAQLAEQQAIIQAQAEGRTPEEIAQLRQGMQREAQLAQAIEQIAQEKARNELLAQQLAPVAKQQVATALAQQYGVTAADLMEARSPEAMEDLARVLARYQRSQQLQARREQGTDRAESGGGGALGDDAFLLSYSRGQNDDHERARKILARL